jgi:hypothetical protein
VTKTTSKISALSIIERSSKGKLDKLPKVRRHSDYTFSITVGRFLLKNIKIDLKFEFSSLQSIFQSSKNQLRHKTGPLYLDSSEKYFGFCRRALQGKGKPHSLVIITFTFCEHFERLTGRKMK